MATQTQILFSNLRGDLNGAFLERDQEVEGVLLAAVAREHVVLIGPPGTGKSALARAVTGSLGASYFETLFTRFTTPEEVFGPFKLSALQNDRFTRNAVGRLPEAEVAFLDEVFKAGSGLLNALLAALNERTFHDDGKSLPIPLRLAIGASNELPAGDELGALWDRFLLRYDVSPLRKRESRRTLLSGKRGTVNTTLSLADLDAAHDEAAQVKVPDDTVAAFMDLLDKAAAAGIYISDRRAVKLLSLVRASAWLDGCAEADPENFGCLAHALWNSPDQRSTSAEIVAASLSPQLVDATKVFDVVMASVPSMLSKGGGDAARAIGEIETAAKRLRDICKPIRKGSRARARAKDMLDQLAKLHQEAITKSTAHYGLDDDADDGGDAMPF